MRKLIYIANARIPTEKAHGIQIMKTCEALGLQGVDLELWVPKRKNRDFDGVDPYEYYGVERKFKIEYLPCRDTIGKFRFLPGLGYYLQSKSFARAINEKLKQGNFEQTVFYTRDTYPIVPVMKRVWRYFYEVHTLNENPNTLTETVIKNAAGIFPITAGLAHQIEKFTDKGKIQVLPDGVDLKRFVTTLTKGQAREKLGLEAEDFYAVYTGHLYAWKGAKTLLQSFGRFSGSIVGIFVGGTESDIAKFKAMVSENNLQNVKIIGHRSPEEIPMWLAAADVLVLPNSGKFEISRTHTSPLKLFEYMAADRPIVASDLPSIREVLDDKSAKFFEPDNEKSLAEALEWVKRHQEDAQKLAQEAKSLVEQYSWENRAKKIVNFISS